jgi:cyclopropane fatty-acyl-phospholipid synthase-like methyltransferase
VRQTCLMLGAGSGAPLRRLVSPTSTIETETTWLTLDSNEECNPNELFDLEALEEGGALPFPHRTFDEVHAYEVLEHFGRQGDYRGLFATFRAIWAVLKLDGLLLGTCPSLKSDWLWGEPGHTRVISHKTLSFLQKEHYDQLGKTACSDYRSLVNPCWWKIQHSEDIGETYTFVLRKVS